MVVTEASAEGGWSGEASSVVHEHCFGDLQRPVKRHCGMRTGIPYGPTLERQCIPSAESIAGAARHLGVARSTLRERLNGSRREECGKTRPPLARGALNPLLRTGDP